MSRLPMPFANPATYKGHSGVDYPQARGTTIRASGPGRVVTRSRNARGGFYVWVQYDNGPRVGYHHMDSHNGCPAVGERVAEGTRLGYVGSLGQFSTGPHLHSEVAGHATTDGYWQFFDPSRVVGGSAAGGIAPDQSKEDDMFTDDDRNKLHATYAALFGPANVDAPKMIWQNPDGQREAYYGVLDIVIYNQALITAQSAALRALATAQGADPAAISALVERAVHDAMGDVTFSASVRK